jgi:hypothetical protein
VCYLLFCYFKIKNDFTIKKLKNQCNKLKQILFLNVS